MIIEQNEQNCCCKMQKCTNKAKYVVKINKKIVPITLRLCKEHLKQAYECLAKEFTPKGLKNIIKKGDY